MSDSSKVTSVINGPCKRGSASVTPCTSAELREQLQGCAKPLASAKSDVAAPSTRGDILANLVASLERLHEQLPHSSSSSSASAASSIAVDLPRLVCALESRPVGHSGNTSTDPLSRGDSCIMSPAASKTYNMSSASALTSGEPACESSSLSTLCLVARASTSGGEETEDDSLPSARTCCASGSANHGLSSHTREEVSTAPSSPAPCADAAAKLGSKEGSLLPDTDPEAAPRAVSRVKQVSKCRFKGVCLDKATGGYKVYVSYKGKKHYVCCTADAELGAKVYDCVVLGLHGALAITNFPAETYSEQQIEAQRSWFLNRHRRSKLNPCQLLTQTGARVQKQRTSVLRSISGYRGVSLYGSRSYQVQVSYQSRSYRVACKVADAREAARIYDRTVLGLHGADAITNFPGSEYTEEEVKEQLAFFHARVSGEARCLPAQRPPTTEYKGVSRQKGTGGYMVRFSYRSRKYYICRVTDPREGARIYDRLALAMYGSAAVTTFPASDYTEEEIQTARTAFMAKIKVAGEDSDHGPARHAASGVLSSSPKSTSQAMVPAPVVLSSQSLMASGTVSRLGAPTSTASTTGLQLAPPAVARRETHCSYPTNSTTAGVGPADSAKDVSNGVASEAVAQRFVPSSQVSTVPEVHRSIKRYLDAVEAVRQPDAKKPCAGAPYTSYESSSNSAVKSFFLNGVDLLSLSAAHSHAAIPGHSSCPHVPVSVAVSSSQPPWSAVSQMLPRLHCCPPTNTSEMLHWHTWPSLSTMPPHIPSPSQPYVVVIPESHASVPPMSYVQNQSWGAANGFFPHHAMPSATTLNPGTKPCGSVLIKAPTNPMVVVFGSNGPSALPYPGPGHFMPGQPLPRWH